MSERPKVVVLSGRGRHEDAWHDHAATSNSLAAIFSAISEVDVVVRSAFRGALDDLTRLDLLVMNLGRPMPGFTEAGIDGTDEDWAPYSAWFQRWARHGGRLLAVHQAVGARPADTKYHEVLGGKWVEGRSHHPPLGPMSLTVDHGAHPVTALVGRIEAIDERYCDLDVAPTSQVLGWVDDDDGTRHPALWVNEAHGGRTVYSALGHDVRSYESVAHQELLVCAALWLLS